MWNQVFGYDRYGNRNITSGIGQRNLSFSANRITTPGYSYDSAGNTTADPSGKAYTYDAENKQTFVNGGNIGQYWYDGDGRRVKKYVPSTGEMTIFVYDASGRSIAEYSTIVTNSTDAKVAYVTNDQLASTRIVTDQNGAIAARHDYHPFGEEISTSQRTAALGYIANTVRKQFTGYERDAETNLDYAQARYYLNLLGRFSTPDDLLNDSSTNDPQSWNKYAFVRNTPLNLVDPTGEKATITVTTDKKNKTGTIVITASFGIYAQVGEYSQAELEQQAAVLQKQIEETYKGGFVLDGVTYTVSASVTTKVFGSESDAAVAGQKGEVDNIVGLRATSDFSMSQNGGKTTAGYVGAGYNIANEDFDRMVVSTGNTLLNKRNTYAHEFGHLMGGGHLALGKFTEGLMRDGTESNSRGRYLTSGDFDMLLASPARKHVAGTGGPFPNGRSSNSIFVQGVHPASTNQVVRAQTLKSVKLGN